MRTCHRHGTPPSKRGPFTSGFEEEFETSLTSRRSSSRPELALFFKEVDKELLRDPGEELKKVLAFKDRTIAEKEILFEPFKERSEFESKIRACITAYVQKLRDAESQKLSDETQATQTEPKPSVNEESEPAREPVIAQESAQFLRNFVTTAEAQVGDMHTSTDVARFRLLATTISEQGNDEATIGAHDANLMFANRLTLNLDHREKAGLVRSGLENFTSENVPLWFWYVQIDGFERRMLAFYSFFRGAHRLQANALAAMRLIEEPLPTSKEMPREFFLRRWFNKESPSDQKSAALVYLSECGLPEDLPAIRKEFERGDYQTRSAAVDAIICINLRQGREQAIKALYELQPDSIDKRLLGRVFNNDSALDDEILNEGTQHRSALVRRITASILAKRNKLQVSDADRLLADTDEDVRYIALSALVRSGRVFSMEQASSALLRQTSGGLLGGFGVQSGEKQLARFKEHTFAEKTDTELEALVASASVFDRDAKLILMKRHFPRLKDELRLLIEDQFMDDFAKAVAGLTTRYGNENQLVKDTWALEDFVRKGFTRQALDIVCKIGGAEHLGLVRKTLEGDFVGYSQLDVEYLQKHGEWQDIPLIIAATGRSEHGGSILSTDYATKYRSAAKAMYAVGKGRLPELLEHEMPKPLLSRLIIEISDKSFRTLSNDRLKDLLLDTDDTVRKACAIKAIRTLSRKRLTQILEDYIESEDQRYYNVTHWLDLGVSVPRDMAQKAAAKVIYREWPDGNTVFD